MNTTIKNFKGQEFQTELTYSHEFNGKGSYIINIDVFYEIDRMVYVNRFEEFTTNSMLIDDIQDLRNDDASTALIQSRYHDGVFNTGIEEQIIEWIESLDFLFSF